MERIRRTTPLYDLIKHSQKSGRINLILDMVVWMEELVKQFYWKKFFFALIPFAWNHEKLIYEIQKKLRNNLYPEESECILDKLIYSTTLVGISAFVHKIYSCVLVIFISLRFGPSNYNLLYFASLQETSKYFSFVFFIFSVINFLLYYLTFLLFNNTFDRLKKILLEISNEAAESLVNSLRIANKYREREEAQEQEANLRRNLLTLVAEVAQYEFDANSKLILQEAKHWKKISKATGLQPERISQGVQRWVNKVALDSAVLQNKGEIKASFLEGRISLIATSIEKILQDIKQGALKTCQSVERKRKIEYKYNFFSSILASIHTYGVGAIGKIEIEELLKVLSFSDQYNVVYGDIHMNQAGRDINQVKTGDNSSINIAETMSHVTTTISQLSNTSSLPEEDLKELLKELVKAIEKDESLSKIDKNDLLADGAGQLAEAAKTADKSEKETLARRAKRTFESILRGLPETAKVVEACQKLLPVIFKLLAVSL